MILGLLSFTRLNFSSTRIVQHSARAYGALSTCTCTAVSLTDSHQYIGGSRNIHQGRLDFGIAQLHALDPPFHKQSWYSGVINLFTEQKKLLDAVAGAAIGLAHVDKVRQVQCSRLLGPKQFALLLRASASQDPASCTLYIDGTMLKAVGVGVQCQDED